MQVSLILELMFVVKFEKVTHFFLKLSVGRIRNVLIRIQIQIFILIQRIQQGSDPDSKTRLKYWIWILQNCKCSRTRQNERDPLIRQKIKRAPGIRKNEPDPRIRNHYMGPRIRILHTDCYKLNNVFSLCIHTTQELPIFCMSKNLELAFQLVFAWVITYNTCAN